MTQASVDGEHWSTGDTRPGSTSSFVPGPGTAPLGAGSLKMTTNGPAAKAQMFNYGYIGTPLADLTHLSYSAYRSSSSTSGAAPAMSLNIEV